jgi:hypothetical protein
MRGRIRKPWPGWHAFLGCLALGLLAGLPGCGGNRPNYQQNAEVTGTVTFKGKPLPGGKISFVTVVGGLANSGTINEDGTYKVEAPVGQVQISIDNRVFRKHGAGHEPMLKRPGAEELVTGPAKGRFVAIPTKYYNPGESGLTYTVEPGSHTHNINLEDAKVSPSPSPP